MPAGTCVRVRGGRITGVGPAESLGPPGSAEPVDLAGGTLLPGFIDAHAHPVFAGHQLRRCDLSAASTEPDYLEIIARYAREHPDEEWITGDGWYMAAFPGGTPRPGSRWTPWCPTARSSSEPRRPRGLGQQPGAGLAGIDRDTPDPPDGRIERDQRRAGRHAPGGRDGTWWRGCCPRPPARGPATASAAQAYLLRSGSPPGRTRSSARPEDRPDRRLPAGRQRGDAPARAFAALWWDRDQGPSRSPSWSRPADRRRSAGFRATRVKMMQDGVAENHTAAMLEPYLDGDGAPTGNRGLSFIDPAELPRLRRPRWTRRASRSTSTPSATARCARPSTRSRPPARANGRCRRAPPPGPPAGRRPRDSPRFARARRDRQHPAAMGLPRSADGRAHLPVPGERRAGCSTRSARCTPPGRPVRRPATGRSAPPTPCWPNRTSRSTGASRPSGRDRPGPVPAGQALDLATALAAYTSGSARANRLESVTGSISPGLDADFAVIDADLAAIRPEEICQASVRQTWLRGHPT